MLAIDVFVSLVELYPTWSYQWPNNDLGSCSKKSESLDLLNYCVNFAETYERMFWASSSQDTLSYKGYGSRKE